ncbi:MAG: His/Gly/Thr/Pro-type tRNA ligase C-terminal domain-containing protein, partial [Kangiellaceae bacterium]|nr:His/Gly/Thr/Pro-type tRNA ligase C-terminal domain-containing protein [Kangiellaceae bacterium]
CMLGELAEKEGFIFSEDLRSKLPEVRIQNHCGGGNFKKQLKRADKSGAQIALILGENEIKESKVALKFLRENKEQLLLSHEDLIATLNKVLSKYG